MGKGTLFAFVKGERWSELCRILKDGFRPIKEQGAGAFLLGTYPKIRI